MLSKILLASTLVALPAVASDDVRTGQWEDGSAIAWQCSNKSNVAVKFAFKDKNNIVYQGVLTCGESI